MVEKQIMARGVKDPGVLEAMMKVPRHLFVEAVDLPTAYGDFPVPIGYDQTISQPYIVASMTEALALQGGERILEIGTGSGYQTAVLAEIAGQVFTIEVHKALYKKAGELLASLGYINVTFRRGNGRLGWIDEAPFDGILVTAAPEVLPRGLIDQLLRGGRLVIPIGKGDQILMRYTRDEKGYESERLLAVRFVPLV
jgi:protein-L-isoaspartate(D-aspartate) O-methyltransferase